MPLYPGSLPSLIGSTGDVRCTSQKENIDYAVYTRIMPIANEKESRRTTSWVCLMQHR